MGVRIRPLVVVCADAAKANALVDEYDYIGMQAFRQGRFVIVRPRSWRF